MMARRKVPPSDRLSFQEKSLLVLTFLGTFIISANTALIYLKTERKQPDESLWTRRIKQQPTISPTSRHIRAPVLPPTKYPSATSIVDVDEHVDHGEAEEVAGVKEALRKVEFVVCGAKPNTGRKESPARRSDVEVYFGWKRAEVAAFPERNLSRIALVTQLSLNRLDRLAALVMQWKGPVSAALYLCSSADLEAAEKWYSALPQEFKIWTTLHLVVGNVEFYPINLMRNVAWEGVDVAAKANERQPPDFIFILDVDAQLSTDSAGFLADVKLSLGLLHSEGDAMALIVPAFEFAPEAQPVPVMNLSRTELEILWKVGKVQAMHAGRPSYSGPFKHYKWLQGRGRETKIKRLHYQLMFEPYIIMKRVSSASDATRIVRFFEDFVGRGFNKQSFHFQLWASGYDYAVLPNVFVIDTPHEDSSWDKGAGAFNDNREKWLLFRDDIIRTYQLDCRNIYLRQCDRHGRSCDKACSRTDERSHYEPRKKRTHREHKKPKTPAKGMGGEPRSETTLKKHSHEARKGRWWREQVGLMEVRAKSGTREEDRTKLKTSLPRCAGGVDVVYTWVNGSDPWHLSVQQKWIPQAERDGKVDLGGKRFSEGGKGSMRGGDFGFRFRDFGEASTLRYSLRSFLKFAPWVNRFWIVSAGRFGNKSDPQVPSWLDLDDEEGRVRVVSHEDIFNHPEQQLPTLNSCAIETRINHIPGLADCYIYVNDDFLLLAPLSMEDLWDKNEPLPFAFFNGARIQRIAKDAWAKKVVNVGRMLHKGVGLPWEQIFLAGHYGHFMIKSVAREAERALQNDYDRTSRERWRTDESLWVPFVYTNYYAWNYASRAKKVEAFYHRLTDAGGAPSVKKMFRTLSKSENKNRWTWLCVNDLLSNFTQPIKEALLSGFEELYPQKSSFELS